MLEAIHVLGKSEMNIPEKNSQVGYIDELLQVLLRPGGRSGFCTFINVTTELSVTV